MIFKPDEVTNLKKGRQVFLEIEEGDVRVLKRNFCGVYELFRQDDERNAEYFDNLNFFKNRYGNVHKKFPITNLSKQRLDIYPVVEKLNLKEVFKWLNQYGKVVFQKTVELDSLAVEYYIWISDSENTSAAFQIIKSGCSFSINIPFKSGNTKMPLAG